MYKIIESKSYIKALSKLKKSGDEAALDNLKIIVDKLSKGEKLPQKFKDHQLHGVMSDKRDCHIKGDLVLIYQILNNNLFLLDISNHANLFDSYNLSEGKGKKKRKRGAFGWFGSLNPNAGNPEYNAAFFNSTFSSDGSSGVSVSGGLGEAIGDINDPETQSLNITNKNKSVKNMKNRRLRPVMEAGPHAEQMAKNRYNELQDRYKKLEDECDSCNNASREIELQIEMAELSDEIEQLKKDWGYALDLNESINIREYLNDLDKEDYRDLVNMYESANLTPKNKLKILEAIKNRDNNKVVKLVELYYNGVEDSDSFVRFTLDEDSKM